MEFGRFMDENPTIFHFTQAARQKLDAAGFCELQERDLPRLERGGKYYLCRNDSNLVAFTIGEDFIPGIDGYSIVATHADANHMLLKPTSLRPGSELGLVTLGASTYGGAGGPGWWDRDLGIGGRIILRKRSGAYTSKLVKLNGAVAFIPRLAPHFGKVSLDHNEETREVAVLGYYDTDDSPTDEELKSPLAKKHNIHLLRAIAAEIGCEVQDLYDWELELFSAEPARAGGLNSQLLLCSRLDDRLCSYTALDGLIQAKRTPHSVQLVAMFDNEEEGSLSRNGAYNKLLPAIEKLIFDSLGATADERRMSAARSVILSADVTHAGNPNYLDAYDLQSIPKLNTGMAVKHLGRFATNAVGTAICEIISEEADLPLQHFAPRNDTLSGGTIGSMVASSTGMLTVDIGITILAMHSIREATGIRDISISTRWFRTFFGLPPSDYFD